MDTLRSSLGKSLVENVDELRRAEAMADVKRVSRVYLPNGQREVERRLKQIQRQVDRDRLPASTTLA